jgi:signal transduction histidine kinase
VRRPHVEAREGQLQDAGHSRYARLRLTAIVAPAAFVAALFAAAVVLADDVPLALLVSLGVLTVAAGATLFSTLVFDTLQRSERLLRERNRQLASVQEAATELSSARELRALLQQFVELSMRITSARYGALAIRRGDGSIEEFITAGVTEDEVARIGHPPVGLGLLGVNIYEGTAVRVREIGLDERSYGFPPNHPPMKSLLGVPVVSKGEIIGNLYLADKTTAVEFSDMDEEMVRLFAAHAAAAVTNTRLEAQLRGLAVLEERERIGMDLHDGIIQSIYSVGLKLEGAGEDVTAAPGEARRTIDEAIEDLGGVIRDVRSYIMDLQPTGLGDDLIAALRALADDFRAHSLIDINVDAPAEPPPLTEERRTLIFHIAQEALSNARRHSKATQVRLSLTAVDSGIRLEVADNGIGFDDEAEASPDHRGIRNMAARARAAGSTLSVDSTPASGTLVRLDVPTVASEAR